MFVNIEVQLRGHRLKTEQELLQTPLKLNIYNNENLIVSKKTIGYLSTDKTKGNDFTIDKII